MRLLRIHDKVFDGLGDELLVHGACLASAVKVAMTTIGASISKKRRRFSRVSLRPKPTVPEPGTVALLVLGLVAAALVRWRKKQARAVARC